MFIINAVAASFSVVYFASCQDLQQNGGHLYIDTDYLLHKCEWDGKEMASPDENSLDAFHPCMGLIVEVNI